MQIAPRPNFSREKVPATTSKTYDQMMEKFIDPQARQQYKYMEIRNATEQEFHNHHDKEQKRLLRSVAKRKRKIDKLTMEQRKKQNRPADADELYSNHQYKSSSSSESSEDNGSDHEDEELENLF